MSFDNVSSDAPVQATPAPSQQSAPETAPQSPTAYQAPTQAPATGAPGEGWVPRYRLQETRESAVREAEGRFATREAELRAETLRIQQQLHALVGVTPPADPEMTAIRDQFGRLYPGLSKLEGRAQDLMGIIERAGDLESQTTHYWQNYGRQSMERLFSAAETTLGSPLNEEGKRAVHNAFVGYVSQSPEMTARYAEDPTIVEEFWRMLSSTLIDPVRRVAAAGVQSRVPNAIPQDSPSGLPRPTPAPQPKDMDERAQLGFARFQQLTGKS